MPTREASDPPDDVDIWQRWTVGIGHDQPPRGADADFRYGSAEGPKLVDWTFAMRGPAALDLGFLHVILSELAPEIADNPERPRATNAAAQSEYARLAGMSLADLTAAMEPYLPVVRTFVVLGNVVPPLRERLIQRIEAGLRSED